jgi:hypothetical protein
VGAGQLGEIFVKASPDGLARLTHIIEADQSDRIVKELSCVESIEPITPLYRRRDLDALDILRKSPRGKTGFVTRVRLFDYGLDADQDQLQADFLEVCKRMEVGVSQRGYALKSYTYSAECRTVEQVEGLSGIIGVRSISSMPVMRSLQPRMLRARPLPTDLPNRSQFDGDCPVVVIVDSGIDSGAPGLDSWVVGRETHVAEPYRNPRHGTFVGGLVCWGQHLNPTLPHIDANPCGLFDLQVMPNSDPAFGDTEDLSEQTFLENLETALKQHSNRYRVWNISLSTDHVCSLDEFSPLAEQLDNLQERYQVSFVICAGNYDTPPLLDYPRTKPQLIFGRITSPADSLLGVTVGSISHIDYASSGSKQDHPSPFSRHGAGPNHIIKPDLVHYGGSCATDLSHTTGVCSVDGAGVAENLGTSFATPLVSRSLAQVYHYITPTPSPVLARALLTHHARDPRTGGRVPDGEENFLGFGVPAPPPYCLECTPHSSTLVFEDTLRPGWYLEWSDFPYPASLRRDGRYYGELWMTVAFAPARGARWGTEYCETHIEAHFGVYEEKVDKDTGEVAERLKGLVPPEHKNPGSLYEEYQVARLRKWAPVRTYYGNLNPKGHAGTRWRLMVKLLTRHGIEDHEAFGPQPFSLVVTIADPEKKAPVYDEMAQIIHNRFTAENLTLRAAARVRPRT